MSNISGKSRKQDQFTSFIFIVPAFIILGIFWYYPFARLFFLSVFEWNGILALPMKYVGMRNFIDALRDVQWWRSMANAGFVTLFALTVQNALAFILASFCDRDIRAGRVYRTIFFLPPVLSGIVVGLIWRMIFRGGEEGMLNYFLSTIGLDHLQRDWLSNPNTALWCVAIVNAWKGFGWGFIIFLAGLQNIPQQLYEAARVDGANTWQRFTKITFPMMIPVTIMVCILTILGCMQIFAIVASLTPGFLAGYTDVPVSRILSSMMDQRMFGYASSLALLFGGILLLVSLTQVKISRKIKES